MPGSGQFRSFNNLYEPSGVEQLSDDRFIAAENEQTRVLYLFKLNADGSVSGKPLYPHSNTEWDQDDLQLGTLEDLEAIAVGKDEYVYASTSHYRTKGKKISHRSREKLIRFRVQGERIVDPLVFTDHKTFIARIHPILENATKAMIIKRRHKRNLFNIEGLTFDGHKDRLPVGFLSPLIERKSRRGGP